jgi:hypothetical protein
MSALSAKGRAVFKALGSAVSVLAVLVVLTGCARAEPTAATLTTTSTLATTVSVPTSTPPAATQLRGPYLGQEPPGMTPEVFAPGIVSDPSLFEYSGTFSPDGNEYYFNRTTADSQDILLFTRVVDGQWTAPEQLALTAGYTAGEPHVTLDNKRLYFMWERPVPEGKPGWPVYYVVDRTANGWSEPQYAGQGMFLSSSRDGQMYTTDMSSSAAYLARVTTADGVFTNYERLTIPNASGSHAHPCIAPDGSYLLFDVDGSYLFVSFRKADGTWGDAMDLTKHGFDPLAGGAYVSPDGKYLFFALKDDIWWVDSRVIEELRPKE